LIINALLGVAFSGLFLWFGRALYGAMGGSGESLRAALEYSNVVFAGNVLVWLLNAVASSIRGTGNMLVPSGAICVGVVLLIPLSPLLIFGFGAVPALGVAGGGAAVLLTTALTLAVLSLYILSRRSLVRPTFRRLRWALFRDILGVGIVGSVSTLQTTLTIGLTTALVGTAAGPDAVAGYGTGSRLEFLLIPLVFGLGAPLVAMVGTNIGAGQRERALRITLAGALVAFGMTEIIGLAASIWPMAWLRLFDSDPQMLATGAAYLREVGPAYGFFGLGLCLYFASQGAGRLLWPLLAGLLRMVVAVGGGWTALQMTGSIVGMFAALSLALVVYGTTLSIAIAAGVWFKSR
jgi:Na+-driven multidrug efflux pump